MRSLDRWLLFLAGLLLFGLVFLLEPAPGYMDADYYALNGVRIANGSWDEPFLWHYLDDPAGVPHPAFSYWMPLPAWIASLGMALTPFLGDAAARLPFALLSACLPLLTASLGYALTRRRLDALLAGGLALLPGFYLPFLPTSDSFVLLMLFGGLLFLLVAQKPVEGIRPAFQAALLGMLAGLFYLTRAEGLLWLAVVAFLLWHVRSVRGASASVWLFLGVGFSLTTLPWMARNYAVFGTPFSPVGLKPLWLTSYDELYIYPAALLTPARWLASGWKSILQARLWAAGQNLQTALAVQGEIFLFPLVVAGAWRLRRSRVVQAGVGAWGLLFLVMTLAFPFAGARGGFFHAGAALQPLWWALAPGGLRVFVSWGERWRGWRPVEAQRVFAFGVLALAALLTGVLFSQRLLGGAWGSSEAHYRRIEARLEAAGAPPGAVVMVNNPPGYALVSGRFTIAVPYGDADVLREVAIRYRARYLVLESNYRGGPLDALYHSPPDFLRLLFTFEDTRVFAILP